ncbi:MAG: uracil-DNA glycosylase [Planctomycetes bacterium]|nr:uracil-DNA glycosylase [Planctomycetota bacterium]
MDRDAALASVAQQLACDRLLGLTFVPLVLRAAPEPIASAPPAARGPAPVIPAPPADPSRRQDSAERLRVLDETCVKGCRKCGLAETRTQTVFGQGNPAPRLVFVGEGPGYDEDKQGLAFVGAAGQVLTRMIGAMGLTRDEVFICNVVKCRPPGNRTPTADEILACSPYLWEQLRILQPEVIVALGAPAAKTLLHTSEFIGRLRGRFHDSYLSGVPGEGPCVPLMPTYHPAYLLRTPSEKRKTWEDLQQVMHHLGLPPRQTSSAEGDNG